MRLVLFTLLLWASLPLHARVKVSLRESYRQNWSGGIAGNSGSNFHFEVQFSDVADTLLPDTLWIEGHCIALRLKNSADGNGNTAVTRYHTYQRGKRRTHLLISIDARISRQEARLVAPLQEPEAATNPTPPIAYKGVALLCYRYGTERRYYAIPEILKYLDPVNYP
ncbi:MAG: hypothetical protein JNL72_08440 [Flavipsychrobacter sp.]|nr:hypothetical protein [Flavipsychrobacter sp.]